MLTRLPVNGAYEDEEAVVTEWLQDSIEAGTLPEEATLEGLRERGTARFEGLGMFAPGLSLAADVEPDRTLTAYEWHVNDRCPIPDPHFTGPVLHRPSLVYRS